MADVMVSDGYLSVGYDRVNIDDCWMARQRGDDGSLIADKQRFPNGINALSDYMHQLGLKLGIYQSIGITTCMGFPGSYDHLEIDAKTFALWNVDMVKMDGCQVPVPLDGLYMKFGAYLNATGKSIVYSCSWPYYQIHYSEIIPAFAEIAKICNLWRTYHDIKPKWEIILATIDFYGDFQEIFHRYVRPGHWNDPDMLLVGNPKLSVNEAKVQFGIWAILAAPLLMSVDLRSIDSSYKEILLNKEVIDINQDELGIPGKRIFHNSTLDIWFRRLSTKNLTTSSYAFAFLNRLSNGHVLDISVRLIEFELYSNYHFRDVLDKTDLGVLRPNDLLRVKIAPRSIRLIKASP
ncbi:hypothetical protein B4U79_12109, partial [Dinothrombium tinctorium]